MQFRRVFLTRALSAAVLVTASTTACQRGEAIQAVGHVKSATAITQVFGDGQKLTAIAVAL